MSRILLAMAAVVCAFAPSLHAQWTVLNFKIVDAQYSPQLNRVVMISTNPNQLHVYDAIAKLDSVVSLPVAPLSLSVAPSGLHAAIGHDAWVSYVSLSPVAVIKTIPVGYVATSVLLGLGDYAYTLPNRWVRISNGLDGRRPNSSDPYYGVRARIHPNGQVAYAVNGSLYEKYDVTTVPPNDAGHTGVSGCSSFWYANAGNRLIDSCGSVYDIDGKLDSASMKLAGKLARPEYNASYIGAADHVPGRPIAAVRNYDSYSGTPDLLALYDASSLAPAGSVPMGATTIGNGTYGNRVRYLFYTPDGTRLTAVSTVGYDNGVTWYIRTFDMQAGSGSCPITLSSSTTAFPPQGGALDVTVNAPTDCIWQMTGVESWLDAVGGASGVGPRTVTIRAPSSGTGVMKTFTLRAGGATLQLTQAPMSQPSFHSVMNGTFVSAEYDRIRDRVIIATSSPNQLHVWSTNAGGDVAVINLPTAPLGLGLTEDGNFAAVGFESQVGYYDLNTFSLVRMYTGRSENRTVIPAGQLIYVSASSSDVLYAINTTTGEMVTPQNSTWVRGARLQPGGKYIYGSSYNGFRKYETNKVPVVETQVTTTYDNCSAERLWFNETGDRIVDGCGKNYKAVPDAAEDGKYRGKFQGTDYVMAVSHSAALHVYAATLGNNYPYPPAPEVQLFTDDFLTPVGKLSWTPVQQGDSNGPFRLFFNADGSYLHGILVSTNSSTPRLSIQTLSLGTGTSGCAVTLGSAPAPIAGAGGAAGVSITAASNCSWRAITSQPWLTVTSTAIGTGSGAVSFAATQNFTTQARTAKVLVNGAEVTIAQGAGAAFTGPLPASIDPSAGTVGAQPFTVRFTNAAGATTVYVSFGNSPATANTCTVEYTRATNGFRILNDAAVDWTTPSAGVLANGQCTLTNPVGHLSSDNTLILSLPIAFHEGLTGSRTAYLLANDNSGTSGWRQRGSYTIDGGVAGIGVSALLPESGNGPSRTFTAFFTHGGGASQHYLGYMLFLRTPNVVWYTAKNSCLVEYNRISNGMRLINNAGDDWIGPVSGVPLGTPNSVLSNAQCSVNVTAATATVNGATMVVNVPVTFVSSSPVSATFLQAFDVTGKYTGMTQMGNWVTGVASTPAPGPAITSVTNTSNGGSNHTFTIQSNHTGGVSQLSAIHLRIGSTIMAPGVCHVIYTPADNAINLIADNELSLVPWTTTLQNSRCTINTAAVAKVSAGNNLTLSVPISFHNPTLFDGDRSFYANAFDIYGNLTHWVRGGSIRIQ